MTININDIKLFGSIIFCHMAGILGSLFTKDMNWFTTVIKPSFNPPSFVFMPVWLILYTMMGFSLFYIIKDNKIKERLFPISVFSIQLVLNSLWSIIFFGLHSIFWAFVVIDILWIALLLTIIVFYKYSKIAAYLLIPYFLWLSFALFLNYNLVVLN